VSFVAVFQSRFHPWKSIENKEQTYAGGNDKIEMQKETIIVNQPGNNTTTTTTTTTERKVGAVQRKEL
jgi:hypothetical protein